MASLVRPRASDLSKEAETARATSYLSLERLAVEDVRLFSAYPFYSLLWTLEALMLTHRGFFRCGLQCTPLK